MTHVRCISIRLLERMANHKFRPLNFPIFKVGKALPSGIISFPSRIDVIAGNLLALSAKFNSYLRRDRVVYPLNRTAFLSIPSPVFARYYRISCLVMPLLVRLFTYCTRSIKRITDLLFRRNCSNNRPPPGGYNVSPRQHLLPCRDLLPRSRLNYRA